LIGRSEVLAILEILAILAASREAVASLRGYRFSVGRRSSLRTDRNSRDRGRRSTDCLRAARPPAPPRVALPSKRPAPDPRTLRNRPWLRSPTIAPRTPFGLHCRTPARAAWSFRS